MSQPRVSFKMLMTFNNIAKFQIVFFQKNQQVDVGCREKKEHHIKFVL